MKLVCKILYFTLIFIIFFSILIFENHLKKKYFYIPILTYIIIVCLCIWHDITIRRINYNRTSEQLLYPDDINLQNENYEENDLQEIDSEDVESLDIDNVSPNKLIEQNCCICCENFTEDDILSNIGDCKFHLFHKKCTINYLKHNFKLCPLCKK